ncbi:MAG: hypothetical protein A2655_02010 [Candidatus Yanofskybacteria bacterium RIFCSPHIGHO2_01_FULL_43_42]|uniref:EamA domain-containing protein n=1 Tax=Candidatus Yanofskybacteria bacterium RIFCSPLOWO2_01_FULL_43_22 TaxID=1802695 RepID=A0A1F8GJR1_9BACT|nr:MAG: hypothetical protein A2655_02010 [Candidatus Yanofskybacteria bacterium RIFCSPHIGHO2_01_FULL_43_42]OGN13244.1 MAG: hypothetical protein A3D48_02915 [Candidatus Yanofskybacteria bacterium RIFCSPHIGHO2_02_FULL_43_17]OGN24659.1 MAG: hypothetical protein A3A13_01140 [Candidatus Yanofskybacteria bacterium RIFCSPLOWO2_01_FULL_43_22]
MSPLLWLWPLSSGATDAASRIVIKKTDIHGFVLNGMSLLLSFPVYFVWLYFVGFPEIGPQFWSAVFWHVPMFVLILILLVESHRAGSMLKTMPLASLTPAFLIVTGPLMGGGNPTFLGAIGILVVVCGLYVLNIEKEQKGWLTPFKLIVTERASLFMFGVTFIAALSSNLDKIAIVNSSPVFYLMIDHGAVALTLLALIPISLFLSPSGRMTYRNSQNRIVNIGANDFKNQIFSLSSLKIFLGYGAFNMLTGIFHSVGLNALPHVPYFMAGKRSGAIIFAVLFGLIMWRLEIFKEVNPSQRRFGTEGNNLKWKLSGTLLAVVGMVIIILFGNVEGGV